MKENILDTHKAKFHTKLLKHTPIQKDAILFFLLSVFSLIDDNAKLPKCSNVLNLKKELIDS